MKKVFVTGITNVRAFQSAMREITDPNAPEDIPRMALVWSTPGFGKTKTICQYVVANDGIVVRAKAAMNVTWLMRDIVKELGHEPEKSKEALFGQIVDILMARRCPVFIDDVDHLCRDTVMIETLRDLHDSTFTPFVLVGMELADKKLKRHKHLWDRFAQLVNFQPISRADVQAIIEQQCEASISEDGLDCIIGRIEGKYRKLLYEMGRAERIARVHKIKTVTAQELRK